jgi:hypothetical protein
VAAYSYLEDNIVVDQLTIKGTLGIEDIRTATLFVQGINEKLTEEDHSLSLVLNYGTHYLWI